MNTKQSLFFTLIALVGVYTFHDPLCAGNNQKFGLVRNTLIGLGISKELVENTTSAASIAEGRLYNNSPAARHLHIRDEIYDSATTEENRSKKYFSWGEAIFLPSCIVFASSIVARVFSSQKYIPYAIAGSLIAGIFSGCEGLYYLGQKVKYKNLRKNRHEALVQLYLSKTNSTTICPDELISGENGQLSAKFTDATKVAAIDTAMDDLNGDDIPLQIINQ